MKYEITNNIKIRLEFFIGEKIVEFYVQVFIRQNEIKLK